MNPKEVLGLIFVEITINAKIDIFCFVEFFNIMDFIVLINCNLNLYKIILS